MSAGIKALPSAKVLLWSKPVRGIECAIVEEFDEKLNDLVDVLTGTMYSHRGVGMSAPQIAVFQRVAVIQLVEERTRPPFVMVNPAIVNSGGEQTDWEGCLSLPGNGTRQRVARPFFVKVVFQDINGQMQSLEANGLMARAIQHEIDHLTGEFFIDRVSALKRNMVLNNYRKTTHHDMSKYRREFEISGSYVPTPVPKARAVGTMDAYAMLGGQF